MGIYISGVKGLPEQVQENKNKIKEVEEQIEGIDFEAVRQLQGQVAENTQDINNLEASIGVQNQAINGLKDRADALESKTQKITYDEGTGKTDFADSIEVADDVYASNVRVMGDGSLVNTSQSGIHFKEGANDDTLTIANNDGTTPHYLHFKADGTIDIDGNPVGSQALYEHNIKIIRGASNQRWEFEVRLITTTSSAFLSASAFNTWLFNNYAQGNYISATGRYAEQVNSTYNYSTIFNLHYSGTNLNADVLTSDFTNGIVNLESKVVNLSSSAITFYDFVRQIA